MIVDDHLIELESYRLTETSLPMDLEPTFGPLVVGAGNEQLPVHRWFRFKEGYSGDLLLKLLTLHFPKKRNITLLDPFCGMGTTLLSGQTLETHKVRSIGIEYNPFIRFAALTKLKWPLMNSREMLRLAGKVIDAPPALREEIPELSGFSSERCMSQYIACRLIGIRNSINQDGKSANHKALLLGLAASIEPLSRTRKDGRALRIVERDRKSVTEVLMGKWLEMADDIDSNQTSYQHPNPTQIISGDGRNPLDCQIEPDSIDLVVTSPPYLNNIDYSEVYKLELWLMDFIRDSTSFLKLRKGTLRSHPTSKLSIPETEFLKLIEQGNLRRSFGIIMEKLDTQVEKWRRKLFVAYFSDMHRSFTQQYKVLRKGGLAFCIVGNSMHGGQYAPYVIATDILLCELARSVGFIVQKLSVARPLRRRLSGNHFLRESVIALRKPDA